MNDSHIPNPDFYQTLSPVEQIYWHKLAEVFQMVSVQKPEKGIKALLLRARVDALTSGVSLEEALKAVYQGARERTERRVALLSRCQLPKPTDSQQ